MMKGRTANGHMQRALGYVDAAIIEVAVAERGGVDDARLHNLRRVLEQLRADLTPRGRGAAWCEFVPGRAQLLAAELEPEHVAGLRYPLMAKPRVATTLLALELLDIVAEALPVATELGTQVLEELGDATPRATADGDAPQDQR